MLNKAILVWMFGGLLYVPWFSNAWEVPTFCWLVIGGVLSGWLSEWRWEWLTRVFACLVVVNVIGLLVTDNQYYTVQGVVFNVCGMGVMYGAYRSHLGVERFFYILGVIAGMVALGSFAMWYGGTVFPKYTTIGWLGNANYTSNFFILPIIGLSWLVILKGKWVWVLPLVLCVLALNVTRGRASILGIAIGILVLCALSGTRRVLVGGIAGCLLAGTLFLATGNRAQLLSEQSLGERLKYWRAAVEIWKERPVFGSGIWSFRSEVYEAQARLGNEYFKDYDMPKPRRVHNDWLETLSESGVVGFGVMSYLILSVGLHAWRRRREWPVLFAGWVGTMVGSFFMFPTRLSVNFAYLCIFYGVIESERRSS